MERLKRLSSRSNGEYFGRDVWFRLTICRSHTPHPSGRGRDEGWRRQESPTKTNTEAREKRSDRQGGRNGEVSGDEQGYRHSSDTETEHREAELPDIARRRNRRARSEEEVQEFDTEKVKPKRNPGQDLGKLSCTRLKCAHNLPFRWHERS
jgi:hypothetical protein